MKKRICLVRHAGMAMKRGWYAAADWTTITYQTEPLALQKVYIACRREEYFSHYNFDVEVLPEQESVFDVCFFSDSTAAPALARAQ